MIINSTLYKSMAQPTVVAAVAYRIPRIWGVAPWHFGRQ